MIKKQGKTEVKQQPSTWRALRREIPVRSQQQDKETTKKSRGVVVGGGLFRVFGRSAHEGVNSVGVAEIVDVGVKNDLVRAHVVALKDDCESVVLRVEVLVSTVGVDRSSCVSGVSVVYCKHKWNILWNVRVFRGITKALKQQPRPI